MKNQPLKINEATPRPLDVIKCLSLSVVPCFRNGFLTFLPIISTCPSFVEIVP